MSLYVSSRKTNYVLSIYVQDKKKKKKLAFTHVNRVVYRVGLGKINRYVNLGVKDAFLYVYGDPENDEGDVHGYTKRMDDKGQDGYKHRDSFHKQDGNKYGYEKHSEFGQEHREKIENDNAKGLKKARHEGIYLPNGCYTSRWFWCVSCTEWIFNNNNNNNNMHPIYG